MIDNIILHIEPKYAEFTNDKELNPLIVETAGFVPLEVKFKRFEQAGLKAQFNASEFSSSDFRDMYLSPNTEIYPNDDLETIIEKEALQEQIRLEILQKKAKLANLATDERSEEVVSSQVIDSSTKENVNDKELPSDKI